MSKNKLVALGTLIALASGGGGVRAASDKIVGSFAAPATVISGLAYGENVLFLSDPLNMTVFRLDPASGSVLSSFTPTPAPGAGFAGLAYNGGYLWGNTPVGTYRLFKMNPATGSVVASFALAGISSPEGLAADATYVYVSNNDPNATRIFKLNQSNGSLVASWNVLTKYPGGLDPILHVPTSTPVLLNVGTVGGWTYIYDLFGVVRAGEEFKIDVPCPPSNYVGDLAAKDDTHFYFASTYLKAVYELELDWNGQEYFNVAPRSFGKIKALYR